MGMGSTETRFGRHEQEILGLEDLLKEADFPTHNALVIGPGLDSLPYTHWMKYGAATLQQSEWLQRQYSWEHIEVAAMLMRLGKPWTVTVLDLSAEICEAALRQTEVVIDDFFGHSEYAKRFLTAFGDGENDYGLVEAVNAALNDVKITNRLSLLKVMKIPPTVRERITVLQGSVENLAELAQQRRFELATIFNVAMYLESDKLSSVGAALHRVLAGGGVVASDFQTNWLQTAKNFRYEREDYDEGGYVKILRYVTYLSRKPLTTLAPERQPA